MRRVRDIGGGAVSVPGPFDTSCIGDSKNKGYVDRLLNRAASMQMMQSTDTLDHVRISDLVSDDQDRPKGQLQWVQLVLAASGMLGIAYIGFIWMLEAAGIRYMALCGTSSGAIVAGMIASLRNRPDEPVARRALQILLKTNFQDLWDGPWPSKQLLAKEKWSLANLLCLLAMLLWSKGLSAWDNLVDWLKGGKVKNQKPPEAALQHCKWGALHKHMLLKPDRDYESKTSAGVTVYQLNPDGSRSDITQALDNNMRKPEQYPLRLVATELTTQSMVVFPRDADLFYANVDPDPSDLVHASWNLPLYFHPFESDVKGSADKDAWRERLMFAGTIPEKVMFADGAIMSSFPVDLFRSSNQRKQQPAQDAKGQSEVETPALAKVCVNVDMGRERNTPLKINDLQDLLVALASTSSNMNDRAYRHEHPEYKDCMVTISCPDFKHLDFDLPKEQQEKLLIRGMEAGLRFLEQWTADKDTWGKFKQRHDNVDEARKLAG